MSDSHLLPNGRILRYAFRDRLLHWVAGFSYLYLMLTGLAFWSPWLFWLAVVLGGPTGSRELHPWVGLIFMIAIACMYVLWQYQMHITENDRRWWHALSHYVRNDDDAMPPEGRYNAGQKLLFWGFIWCGIALFLTGLVLWFPQSVPWNLRYLRYICVVVHPAAAMLTIGLFMIHVYMGVALERGAFSSMTRGDVSRAWAKKYHRLWYEQIMRGSGTDK